MQREGRKLESFRMTKEARNYQGAQHMFAEWNAVERKIQRANGVAIFLDFDGTLVPIRKHPDDARLSPRLRRLLVSLAARACIVGIVSGRPFKDLRARIGLRQIAYAGSHGFLLQVPHGRTVRLLTRLERRRVVRAQIELRRALMDIRGIYLEHKQAGITAHTRGAPSASAAEVERIVRRFVSQRPWLRLQIGKKAWEILPNSPVSKRTAVAYLLRWARKRRCKGPILAIYAGDDATDETVFRRWNGISIAVGRRHRTAARYYLRSPAAVRRFLQRVKEVLSCDKRRSHSASLRLPI